MDNMISIINNNLRSVISGLVTHKKDTENKLTDIKIKIEDKIALAASFRKEVETARDSISVLEKEIAGLENDLEELNKKFGGKDFTAILEAGNKEINTKIIEKRADITRYSDQIRTITIKAHNLKRDLELLKREKKATENAVDTASTLLDYYETRINDVIDYAQEHPNELKRFQKTPASTEFVIPENIAFDTVVDGSVFDEIEDIQKNGPDEDTIKEVLASPDFAPMTEEEKKSHDLSLTQQLDDVIAEAQSYLKKEREDSAKEVTESVQYMNPYQTAQFMANAPVMQQMPMNMAYPNGQMMMIQNGQMIPVGVIPNGQIVQPVEAPVQTAAAPVEEADAPVVEQLQPVVEEKQEEPIIEEKEEEPIVEKPVVESPIVENIEVVNNEKTEEDKLKDNDIIKKLESLNEEETIDMTNDDNPFLTSLLNSQQEELNSTKPELPVNPVVAPNMDEKALIDVTPIEDLMAAPTNEIQDISKMDMSMLNPTISFDDAQQEEKQNVENIPVINDEIEDAKLDLDTIENLLVDEDDVIDLHIEDDDNPTAMPGFNENPIKESKTKQEDTIEEAIINEGKDNFDTAFNPHSSNNIYDDIRDCGLDPDRIAPENVIKLQTSFDKNKVKDIINTMRKHLISINNIYDATNILITISANDLDTILSGLESTGATPEDISLVFKELNRVNIEKLKAALASYVDGNLSDVLYECIPYTGESDLNSRIGLTDSDVIALKTVATNGEYEKMQLLPDMVMSNYNYLREIGVHNLKECITKHPRRFVMNHDRFVAIMDKYDTDDLKRCIEKNSAVIDKL